MVAVTLTAPMASAASYRTTFQLSNDELNALVQGGTVQVFFDQDPTPYSVSLSRRGENTDGNIIYYAVLSSSQVPSSWVSMTVIIDFVVDITASAFSGSFGVWNQSITFENPSLSLIGSQSGQIVTYQSSEFSPRNITYTQLSDGSTLTRNFNVLDWELDQSMTLSQISVTFEKLSSVQNNSSFTIFFGPLSYTVVDEAAFNTEVIDKLDEIADQLNGSGPVPSDRQQELDDFNQDVQDVKDQFQDFQDAMDALPSPDVQEVIRIQSDPDSILPSDVVGDMTLPDGTVVHDPGVTEVVDSYGSLIGNILYGNSSVIEYMVVISCVIGVSKYLLFGKH